MPFSAPQRNLVFRALMKRKTALRAITAFPLFAGNSSATICSPRWIMGGNRCPIPRLHESGSCSASTPSQPFDFYRIELNDRSILAAAKRENLLRDLHPFLVYILTHEMVHMVRLSSILDSRAETLPHTDESEEERVQGISRRILAGSSNFHPVLERFCS